MIEHQQEPQTPEAAQAAQLNEAFRLFVGAEGWAIGSQQFAAHYRGTWPSLEAYGQQLLTSLGLSDELTAGVPDWLTPYLQFDYAAFAHEDLRRDCHVIEGRTGVHVFDRIADEAAVAVESTTSAA